MLSQNLFLERGYITLNVTDIPCRLYRRNKHDKEPPRLPDYWTPISNQSQYI